MNKHLYRIVFNHALGLFQVVSELVRRPGHGASQSEGAVSIATVRPVSLSLWVAFGWIGLASVATAGQITTDPNAPGNQRPTVLGSPGAAPLVNITTPSKAGVSRNTYSDFNVDQNGVVLNNSRTNTTTQLAGTVAGNPWLATGTAKVILNEVTGSNPSALNGYIEVAGDRAQVIVANPAGISCDGCGVINATRFTLTTGTPVLSGGSLDGYRVTGGAIQIGAHGLDASRADYTDIIARAVQVNGGLWSPQLQVTTGSNQVNADASQVNAIAGTGEKPMLALDVSALGGMYANKIVLLGTEDGVGARNAGSIGASAGDLVVTLDGRLENSGNLQSQANTQITARGGISNSGTISARRELTLNTTADVDNSHGDLNAMRIAVDAASLRNAGGSIAQTGSQGMKLDAGALSNRNGGRIGAVEPDTGGSTGTPSDGSTGGQGGNNSGGDASGGSDGSTSGGGVPIAPLADGVLHITGLLDNDSGRISAAAGFDLASSSGLSNDGGQLELRQFTLTGGNLSNRGGSLSIDGTSTVHANQINNDAGQLTFASAVAMDAQSLSNRSGRLTLADSAPMNLSVAGTLDNTAGVLATNATQFKLNSGTLINEHGTINHAGSNGLTLSTGDWRGSDGTVVTAGAAKLTANAIDHRGATLSATQLSLNASTLDNRGGVISSSGNAANTLTVKDSLDNGDQGVIASNGDLVITTAALGNAGGTIQQAGNGTLAIAATTLNGTGGTLASNGTLALSGRNTDLSYGTTYANAISIDTGSLNTAGGTLQAVGKDALSVLASDRWNNAGGTVLSNGALNIQAGALDNTRGMLSTASANDNQLRIAGTFTNTGGTLVSMGATQVQAGSLLNQGGTLQVAGAVLTLHADGLLDNSQQGAITSDGDLAIDAATLDNSKGSISQTGTSAASQQGGSLRIDAATLRGHGGTLASNGSLTIIGDATDLSGGVTQAQRTRIDTGSLSTAGGSLLALSGDSLAINARGTLDNTGGTIASNGALQVTAQSLNNTDSTLTAAGTNASSVTIAQRLDNTRGTLAAMGATTVQAGELINQGGTLQTVGAPLTLTAEGLLDNSQHGLISSDHDLTLNAATLDNTQGTIQQVGDGSLIINAATFKGQGGKLISNGNLALSGDTLDLGGATTQAWRISVDAGSLITAGGSLLALGGDPLRLSLRSALDNTGGAIATNGALQLTAQSLNNTGGTLSAAGSNASTFAIAQRFDNTRGTLAAMGATTVQAGELINQGGTLQAAGAPLTLHADGLLDNSQQGVIASDGGLSVSAATLDNTLGAIQHAGSGALTIDAVNLHGRGGTLVSNGTMMVTGDSTDLSGGTTQAQTIRIDTGDLSTAGGSLIALGSGPLQLAARRAFDNSAGTVATNGALQLAAQTLSNIDGTLSAAGTNNSSLNIAQRFDNTRGTLATMGTTTVQAGELINQHGTLQTAGSSALTLAVDGLLDNSTQGIIASDGDLTLTAATFDNTDGKINHAGLGDATIHATTLNGRGGTIASNGNLTLTGDSTDLSGGATQAQRIRIDTGTLSTADGTLQALSSDPLQLTASRSFDNSGGKVVSNGALQLDTGALLNRSGQLIGAGPAASSLQVGGLFDNTGGTLATAGATTLHAGTLDNTVGALQAASTDTFNVTVDGQLTNEHGSVQGNGALATTAADLSNRSGTIQAQQAISAHVGNTLDNTAGAIIASGDLSVQAQTLLNRDTVMSDASAPPTGLHGQGVTLAITTLDNTRGQVQARDALSVTGGTLINVGGMLDGTGKVQVTGSTLDNTGGQLVQRGDSGALALDLSQTLRNTAGGLIGAEGSANIHAGNVDNSGGTTFARHDLTLSSDGDVFNRDGGVLQANGALALRAQDVLDNSGGSIDATQAASIAANAINNVGGQIVAGDSAAPNAALQINAAANIDNRSGTLGNRGGDLLITTTALNNSADGTLVAQRNLNLDALGTFSNAGGTVYAAGDLSFQNGGGTLDNSGGKFGAGGTAALALASLTNTDGRVQANTLWLSTPVLNNERGDIGANSLHATLISLNGIGTLLGTDLLDAHFLGDYTHIAGQQLQSDGTLSLAVDGTLTNQDTLQTQGILNVSAANLINQGTINASNSIGTAEAHLTAAGLIDNQTGASIEGDALNLTAANITNTSNQGIVGDVVRINADNLTNGRDLGTADAAIVYGEGFIGASQYLDLRIGQHLANLDGDIYSGGDLSIAGRNDGTRLATLDNVSGRIQAEGNARIAADLISNRRRFIETEQYTLSANEQFALSSDRAYDNALSAAEQQRMTQLFATENRTTAQISELLGYLYRTGWSRVEHVSDADLATLNATYNQIAIQKYDQRGGYLVVGAGGNPGAELKQTDTYLTGTRITRESAESQILTGGNLSVELGTHLSNVASTITLNSTRYARP